jgi:hypothetical protein
MREDQVLAGIVRRVDTGDIARRMVEIFRRDIAAYRRLPDSAIEGQVLEISKRNVDLFLSSIVEGRTLTEAELQPFRESARNRADEGLPLEDLLHAYRLGGRLSWEALIDTSSLEEQVALLPSVARLMEYVDRVSDAVTETYHDWSRHLASEEERRVHDLLDALMAGAPLDAAMLAAAELDAVPVVDEYMPFGLALSGAGAHAHSQRAAVIRRHGVLAVTEGNRIVGLLVTADGEAAFASENQAVWVVGEATGRTELHPALAEVRALLGLGLRLGRTGRMHLEDHLPELLLAGSPRIGERLRRRALGPLEDYAERRRADLLETLRTFVACDLDRRSAAKRLHVHPNTLDYRLRRVEELTGLRLSSTSDLVLTCLALKHRGDRA